MLRGLSILIVEDEPLLALDLADAIKEQGGHVLGPVATVSEALTLIENSETAGAILDASLLDRDVTPLALYLVDRGTPFIVHTGTGLPDALAKSHPDLPVILKPARTGVVLEAVITQIEVESKSIGTDRSRFSDRPANS